MHYPDDNPGINPGNETRVDRRKEKNLLHVHHKKEVKDYPELALVLDNIETLCRQCHNDMHPEKFKKIYKQPKFMNDERW